MSLILRIAFRNLLEHKMKSLIIMGLIALGMVMLLLGNSVLDTGKAGMEKSFIANFSGDILVGPRNKNGVAPQLFSFGMQSGNKPITVKPYKEVLDLLKSRSEIKAINPQVSGTLFIKLPDDYRGLATVFGVDLKSYQEMFPDNLALVQMVDSFLFKTTFLSDHPIGSNQAFASRLLKENERGLLLSEKTWKEITEKTGKTYIAGKDSLTLMTDPIGLQTDTIPLVGVIHFKTQNSAIESMSFVDVDSLRGLKNMVLGTADQIQVSSDTLDKLKNAGNDSLEAFISKGVVGKASKVTNASESDIKNELSSILKTTAESERASQADQGSWSYILLRLNPGTDLAQEINDLNAQFKEKDWNLVAVDWQGAAGFIATITMVVQIFFYILVLIITIVSAIIIMNTMVVSIMERTAEIGTMRALGAQKSYIRQIFLTETFTLSVVGGIIGMIVGGAIIVALNASGIVSPNPLFELVFGGKMLYPIITGTSAIAALLIILGVGFLSSLYPTAVALKIQPVKAMQS